MEMKDLTHYFQSPPKEEKTSQKENVDVISLQDDNEEMFIRKNDKVFKSKSKHTSKSSLSSNLKIENSESSSSILKVDESKQDDCQEIPIILQDTILNDAKIPSKNYSIETGSSQTDVSKNFKRKEKMCLSSSKISKRKKSSKNVADERSVSSCENSELSEKISNIDPNENDNSSNENIRDSSSKHCKTAIEDNTIKTPPQLNDNTNAFYILMSTRAWKSPHTEESKNGNESSSAEKNMKQKPVTETAEKTAEIKENNKKRKQRLEDMAEQKRTKKIKHSSCQSEKVVEQKTNIRSKRRLIIPESDSDDDKDGLLDAYVNSKTDVKYDDKGKNVFTDYQTDKPLIQNEEVVIKKNMVSKSESSNNRSSMKLQRKSAQKANCKFVIEETDDSSQSEEENKIKETVCKDEIEGRKKKIKSKQKLIDDNSKKTAKINKLVVEHSEAESEKRKIEKCQRISPQKLGTINNVKNPQMKRKLMNDSPELKNETSMQGEEKKRNKLTLSRKKDDSVNVKLTDQLQSPLSFKKNANRASKTPIKEIPNKREKKKKKEFKEVENGCVEISKESNSVKSTDITPSRKKEKHEVAKDKSCNSKCDMIESNVISQSSEHVQDGKKRNSLFSYFNKVPKCEVISKPEVIKVKAQIHSPPSSPSTKRRSSRVARTLVNQRRQDCYKKLSDKEDQIIVLESSTVEKLNKTSGPEAEVKTPKAKRKEQKTPPSSGWRMRVKLRKSSPEPDEAVYDEEDSGNMFTPKKNWPANKPSVQQIAAREVLKKAKTRFTQRSHNDRSPTLINVNKTPPVNVKSDHDDSDEVIICSSSEKNLDTSVKLAPLFVRAKPKPKLDPAVVEARKNFLKSGVPETVKKFVDLQRSMEEQCYFTFPTIAHIQQRDEKSVLWHLPFVNFLATETVTDSILPSLTPFETIKLGTLNTCVNSEKPNLPHELSVPTPIKSFRNLLRSMKIESPDFAVYRNFRRLRMRNNHNTKNVKPETDKKEIKNKRRSGRKSKNFSPNEVEEDLKSEICNINTHVMWTEKYKPLAAEDIIGNGRSVEQLKKWLETWKRCNDEMLRKDKGEHKRKDSSSGDEFMNFDDSNDSINGNLPNNTAILIGPHGCGKTATVYAIANELGCKVLEINASSKRSGKRMLSELQEATQSHQVRASTDLASAGVLSSFLKGENSKPKKKKSKTAKLPELMENENEDNGSSKMSLILVEGADLVYEDQDEGFISALNTLVASSKRPVILVANDSQSSHLIRFMDSKLVFKFSAPSSKTMSVWLQLICLLEGLRVSRAEIERLLDKNLADVRQTVLQLQFWVLSGGSNLPVHAENIVSVSSEKHVLPQTLVEDEQSNLSWASNEETDDKPLSVPEHSHCVQTFTEYDQQIMDNQQLPFPMDLNNIWWNLASLLSLPETLYHGRMDSQAHSTDEVTLKDCDEELYESDNDCTKGVENSVTDVSKKPCYENDTVSLSSTKQTDVSETLNKSCLREKEDSAISLPEGTENNSVKNEQSMSQNSEIQSTKKNLCSQLEIDSMFNLLERMSTIDIISSRTDMNCLTDSEPCLRSWDQVPHGGTSLSESRHSQWWENSVSRVLCHRLIEGSVHRCRTQLQKARNCSEDAVESKITYCRPTQSELRWRASQHAASSALLSGVAVWNRIDHQSICTDYFPMLRAVSRCERERLTSNTKRRNRFFHYLKGLNIHVGETTLETLCATFDNKVVA